MVTLIDQSAVVGELEDGGLTTCAELVTDGAEVVGVDGGGKNVHLALSLEDATDSVQVHIIPTTDRWRCGRHARRAHGTPESS